MIPDTKVDADHLYLYKWLHYKIFKHLHISRLISDVLPNSHTITQIMFTNIAHADRNQGTFKVV